MDGLSVRGNGRRPTGEVVCEGGRVDGGSVDHVVSKDGKDLGSVESREDGCDGSECGFNTTKVSARSDAFLEAKV